MPNRFLRGIPCLIGLSAFHLLAAGRQQVPVFKSEVELVEVYATVTDRGGRSVRGLTKDQFELRDNGQLQSVTAFEDITTSFSCAFLLDATGSMQDSLPMMQNSVLRIFDNLRPDDLVAVYSFTTSLTQLQDFTTDKRAAKRAVLGIRASGATALFDSIARIATGLSIHKGKKSVVVFTDGGENSSLLHPEAALVRARTAGLPIYTIAQGEALKDKTLLAQLERISSWTGADTFQVKDSRQMERVFRDITRELQATYMLAYMMPETADSNWRTINLAVKGIKNVQIHAREGYFPKVTRDPQPVNP